MKFFLFSQHSIKSSRKKNKKMEEDDIVIKRDVLFNTIYSKMDLIIDTTMRLMWHFVLWRGISYKSSTNPRVTVKENLENLKVWLTITWMCTKILSVVYVSLAKIRNLSDYMLRKKSLYTCQLGRFPPYWWS